MSSKDKPRRRPTAEGLEKLLGELQEHTRNIGDSWQSGESARLRMLAGQLASLAAGSGNAAVSELAAELESMLIAEEAEASAICERVESLIQQCKKAAGPKI